MHATERRRIREGKQPIRVTVVVRASNCIRLGRVQRRAAPGPVRARRGRRPVPPPGPPFLHPPPPRHVVESRYHGVRDEECGANVRLRALVSRVSHHCRALLPAPAVCVESRSVGTAPFAVVKLQIPSDAVPTDENERERSEWWRAKKWAYEVLGRLFHRFGNPSQLPSTMQAENSAFAAHFVSMFAPEILAIYLRQVELYVSNQQWLRKKCQYQISSFFMRTDTFFRPSIKPKSTWTLLELHVQLLVKSFVLPQLSFTAGQQHLWKSDPLDYVRNTVGAQIRVLRSPSPFSVSAKPGGSLGQPWPRNMRLMSRYSAALSTNPDTMSGVFTQEVRRFGPCHPGADSAKVTLQTSEGYKTLTVSWAATFISSGNTTASFIAETCALQTDAGLASKRTVESHADEIPRSITRKKGVVHCDNQANLADPKSNVQPNRALRRHGLHALKEAGVKYVLIDNSGNRSGYIYAGAVALWSLIPNDLYPAFLSCATQSSPARSPLLMDPAPPPAVSPTAPQLQNAQPRSSMRTGKS
ncbi:hypothetical protein B0H14DRAFT_2586518 [Mycena olivaceomarginata]|nr:hypothetical protein B0H14DRAFT_2586518 [Mycena olivaceomarginata]